MHFPFPRLSVLLIFLFSVPFANGQTNVNTIFWGTHVGPGPINLGATFPSSLQKLYELDSTGGTESALTDSGSGDVYDGDLIQLGFFDTDNSFSISSDTTSTDYSPNTDSSNLFKGVWVPLTSKTHIGRDWDSNTSIGTGEFYFKTKFTNNVSNTGDSANNYSVTNFTETTTPVNITDYLYDSVNDPNAYEAMVKALNDSGTAPYVGIRFYSSDSNVSGSSRYNTIMNTEWQWGDENIRLHTDDGTGLNSNLVFEFDNTDADTASKIGTGDNSISGLTNGDFVATVTYFDGDETINVGDTGGIGSSVFSGFDGTGRLYGANDGNVVTLNSASGNTGADAYEFDGDFYNASTGTDSTDLTIVKSGTGDQILSGNLNLADSTDNASASGGIKVAAGKLILKPASGNTQTVEYLTGAGTLVLDNSGVDAGTIVTLGFANNSSSTFSGSVVLDGNGATNESKIKVSKSRDDAGFVADDFADSQTISGVISNANGNKKLVKDGTGELILTGNNTFTGGVEIDDGTLVAGHANALGSSNNVTITKGKLEVDNGVTLAPATITAGDSEKTMIGGRGTLNQAVTIGSGNGEIDVISAGDGISSSLSNSSTQQQVSLGDRTNAVGTFTVSNTLTLASGGVFDWEVSDFTGSAGSDWDLLKFDTLTLSATSANPFVVNAMSLAADGTAGSMAGGNVWQSYTSNGFKFMEATGNGSGWSGSSGLVDKFSVVSNNWAHYNDQHLHEWNVWYDGSGAFYLQYSAVPEPSTYMMVTGLLMVPGMSYVRRFRKRKASETVEEEPQV